MVCNFKKENVFLTITLNYTCMIAFNVMKLILLKVWKQHFATQIIFYAVLYILENHF